MKAPTVLGDRKLARLADEAPVSPAKAGFPKLLPCLGHWCGGKARLSRGPGDRFCDSCRRRREEIAVWGQR